MPVTAFTDATIHGPDNAVVTINGLNGIKATIDGLDGIKATINGLDGIKATINGNSLNPIAVRVSSPPGESIDVGATISGPKGESIGINATLNGGTPVTAVIEGGQFPVKAAITEPITLNVNLGDFGLRNTTIVFKLFGWCTIWTIKVGP